MKNSVLVIAAHPDDEILGCGGTAAKYVSKGDEVNFLIIAEGATSRKDKRKRDDCKKELNNLFNEANNAASILGVNSIKLLDFPDNRLDCIDLIEIVKIIEDYINLFQPNIIYTHHYGDINIDHEIINRAVLTAARPKPGNCVKKIFTFEVLSSTEWNPRSINTQFSPNWYEDISGFLSKKLDSARAYKSEMFDWPHPRSIESIEYLAKMRGSQVGLESAEAFCLLRNINK